jgi:hypothetical protein
MNPMTAAVRSELRAAIQGAESAPAPPERRPVVVQLPTRVGRRSKPLRANDPAGRPPRRVAIRLWLPLTPLFVVLAPFALLGAPLLALVPEARRVNPYRAALGIGGVLLSLSGTVVSVDAPDASVHIRIF